MRTVFIAVLVLIFASPGLGFALPIESVPAPAVHTGNPVAAGIAPGPPMAKIPDFPVEMFIRRGTSSRFQLFFLNVKYGYDLVDFEFYNSWCLKKGAPLPGDIIHTVRLYNSYDPNMPPEFKKMAWPRINYIINHEKGSKADIQQAIWRLAGSREPRKLDAKAVRLVGESNLKGKDYRPGEGDLVAIIAEPQGNEQPVLLEYKIPQSVPPVVAPATFIPAVSPLMGGASLPSWLPLAPLVSVPFIATDGGGGGGPPSHPPTPPPADTPEPPSLLLLAFGMAGILMYREVGKRLKGRLRGAR